MAEKHWLDRRTIKSTPDRCPAHSQLRSEFLQAYELALNELSSWAEGVLMMAAKKRNRPLLEVLMRFGAQVPALSKLGRFYYFVLDDIAAFLIAPVDAGEGDAVRRALLVLPGLLLLVLRSLVMLFLTHGITCL